MTSEVAVAMAFILILFLVCLGLFLFFAGAAELERRADRWAAYERWMHPPDDNGDGVTLLENKNEEE